MSLVNIKIAKGKYTKVRSFNDHFDNVVMMLLEHFDLPEFEDAVFIINDYYAESVNRFRSEFPGKRIIVYQLEQLVYSKDNWWNPNAIAANIADADEVWDYDPLNAEFLKERGVEVTRVVPMLYTKTLELRTPPKDRPRIDVLFYGTGNTRRLNILYELQLENFMDMNIVWSAGPADNNEFMLDSKIILNLHAFDPWHRQEQVRMFYPVINGKTVVSETSQLNNMQGCVIEVDGNNIASYMKYILKSGIWKYYGLEAKKNLQSKTEKFMFDFHRSLKEKTLCK